MTTRWMMVCEAATQPAFAPGNTMNCVGAGGAWRIMPIDTVITESSPLLNLGQLLAMTPDEALIISSSIAVLWAIAWGVRAVAHSFLNPSERNHDD